MPESDEAQQLIYFLIIGAVAGWLAGQVMKGKGFGLIGNMVIGVLGAVVGGYVFGLLDLAPKGELMGPLVTAFAGAVVLIFAVGLLKKN